MNKKMKNALVYLTSLGVFSSAVLPAFASLKDKLRPIYASGAVEQRLSFHGNGYTLAGDQTYIVGPVKITNLGTYAGKGAAFEVLYKPNDIKNAGKIFLNAARKANPNFNHEDLEELIGMATPSELEAQAVQDAFGPADSLVTEYDITKPELGRILSAMKQSNVETRPFIIRYHSGKGFKGESGLWMPIVDKKKIIQASFDSLIKRMEEDIEEGKQKQKPIKTIPEIKKSNLKFLIGGIIIGAAAAGKVFYDRGKHDASHNHPNPSNGTMTGGDEF